MAAALDRLLLAGLSEQIEALARAEPANTGYQRDVSVSYERLACLAAARGEATQAEELYREAISRRQAVFAREPDRVDLAEELAVAFALSAGIETKGTLTAKGQALLRWARDATRS